MSSFATMNNFKFLKDDTRLFQFQNCVYKVKILYHDISNIIPKFTDEDANGDLENVLRAVLFILERKGKFRKIETDIFLVTVKTKPWKAAEKIGFKRNGSIVNTYPHMIILTIEVKPSAFSRTCPVLVDHAIESSRNVRCTPNSVDKTMEQLKHNALNSNVRVALNRIDVHCEKTINNSQSKILNPKNTSPRKNQNRVQCSISSPKTRSATRIERNHVENIIKNQNVLSPNRLVRQVNADPEKMHMNRKQRKRKPLSQAMTASKVPCRSAFEKDRSAIDFDINNSNIRNEHLEVPVHYEKADEHSVQQDATSRIPKHIVTNTSGTKIQISFVQNCDDNEGLRLSSYQKRTEIKKSTRTLLRFEESESTQLIRPVVHVGQLKVMQKDRHFIEKEELEEDMKLQQLAKSSPKPTNKSDASTRRRRHSSGIWNIVETILTPVKKIFS